MTRVAELVGPVIDEYVSARSAVLKNIITPVYNVKGYGAKGDGVTDDTTAVQDAINAAVAAGGKIVWFPPGIYKVTALTNTALVYLVGDNASFSGVSLPIGQLGQPTYEINVLRFGAKGDGVADDTNAIQAAIDAAEVAGGVVFFPPGTYRVTNTLTVQTDRVKLYGLFSDALGGHLSVIYLDVNNGSKHLFQVDGPGGTAVSHVVFEGLELRGPRLANPSYTSGHGIYSTASHVYVRSCRIRYFGGSGVRLRNGWYSAIDNCYIDHNYLWGVYFDGQSNNVRVRGGRVNNNGEDGASGGIRIYGTDGAGGYAWNTLIDGVAIEANSGGSGIRVDAARAVRISACYIENNGSAGTPYQVNLQAVGSDKVQGITIEDCMINGSNVAGRYGILVAGAVGVTIRRGAIIRNPAGGIRCTSVSSGVLIETPYYELNTAGDVIKDAGAGTITVLSAAGGWTTM